MSSRFTAGVMVALCAVAAVGTASAEVFVTSPATGRVLVLDSNGAVSRVLGATGGLTEPYSITVDPDRNLLVADYSAGRVVRLSPDGANGSIVASNIPKPDGLSVGPAGEIFLVSRDNRNAASRLKFQSGDNDSSSYLHQVWMIPAGANLPIQIASMEESFRLAQTLSVSSGTYTGDLLVLSTRPGLIARFTPSGPTSMDRMADFVGYIPGEPTSMALARNGELLVGTSDGRVLRFSDTGVRLQPDFANGLPPGPVRLSINRDGVVHITPVGSTSIIRFDAYAMRLPDLSGATVPLAAAITSGCVPTPLGQHVTVSPAAGVNVIFDNVIQAGQTCLQTTSMGAGVTLSPHGNVIPAFAKKLFEDPGFVVYDVTTTARFTDTIAEEFFSPNANAHLLVAHGSNGVFSDNTVLVTPNDPRGRTGQLSEFVIYLDTRPNRDVVLLKLADLQGAIGSFGPLINPTLLSQIQSLVNQLPGLIGNGGADADRPGATNVLKDLKSFIRLNSGEGIPNRSGPDAPPNVAGTLISLADTLIFQLSL